MTDIDSKERYRQAGQLEQYYEEKRKQYQQQQVEYSELKHTPGPVFQAVRQAGALRRAAAEGRKVAKSLQRVQESFTKGQRVRREELLEEERDTKGKNARTGRKKKKRKDKATGALPGSPISNMSSKAYASFKVNRMPAVLPAPLVRRSTMRHTINPRTGRPSNDASAHSRDWGRQQPKPGMGEAAPISRKGGTALGTGSASAANEQPSHSSPLHRRTNTFHSRAMSELRPDSQHHRLRPNSRHNP